MNYKLGSYISSSKYANVDISEFFKDKKSSYDLENIDNFTMKFSNQYEFKTFLFLKGLISSVDDKLFIYYGKKNVRSIPLLYSECKTEYDNIKKFSKEIYDYFRMHKRYNNYDSFGYSNIIGDYHDITNYFDSFYVMSQNTNFLKALQNYCVSNPTQELNISDINLYLAEKGKYKSKIIYIALFELFRRLFYKYDNENKELVFNYKGFRDFCVFYVEYKEKLKNRQKQKTLIIK